MIKVLKAGFYSTIQDFGRFGVQQFGVPYSGAMDQKAARFANALLGNIASNAVLEMTMVGAELQFKTETSIAFCGANMTPKLNGDYIENNKVFHVKEHDIISFGKSVSGIRAYLAVSGGFKTETVMNSKSMYANVTSATRVLKNDELKIEAISAISENSYAKIRVDNSYLALKRLEVYKGPEFECLSSNQQHQLFATLFTISKNNNRMAYQLNESFHNNLNPIITGPVLPGTVQLTPSGKLIILMRDCQTTGGYPRIFQLSEYSINTLAQKHTGQIISFHIKK